MHTALGMRRFNGASGLTASRDPPVSHALRTEAASLLGSAAGPENVATEAEIAIAVSQKNWAHPDRKARSAAAAPTGALASASRAPARRPRRHRRWPATSQVAVLNPTSYALFQRIAGSPTAAGRSHACAKRRPIPQSIRAV
eukprot:357305-Chlamydomonas_euryale.AAC.5